MFCVSPFDSMTIRLIIGWRIAAASRFYRWIMFWFPALSRQHRERMLSSVRYSTLVFHRVVKIAFQSSSPCENFEQCTSPDSQICASTTEAIEVLSYNRYECLLHLSTGLLKFWNRSQLKLEIKNELIQNVYLFYKAVSTVQLPRRFVRCSFQQL